MTVALIMAVVLTSMDAGGAWVKVMETVLTPVMVTLAVTNFVGSAVAVAVMVTVLPGGMTEGAIYVVGAPLAVCMGVKPPQLPPVQETDQSTPLFNGSFETMALTVAVAFVCIEEGGD
jgi:hypothetical protein